MCRKPPSVLVDDPDGRSGAPGPRQFHPSRCRTSGRRLSACHFWASCAWVCLIPPLRASDPSPGPRRLVRAPSRVTLSPRERDWSSYICAATSHSRSDSEPSPGERAARTYDAVRPWRQGRRSSPFSLIRDVTQPCHSERSEESRTEFLLPRFARGRAGFLAALSKIIPCQSFPRKRESMFFQTDLDPRPRGGDNSRDFHLDGRAEGPCTLGMTLIMTGSASSAPPTNSRLQSASGYRDRPFRWHSPPRHSKA